jgi:phenylalanyl-tRNA synthetase alpha chain
MCYRNEAISTRSEIQFLQVEGLCIGEGVTMADLKGTITAFARRMFGPERQVRIRSSYFPFTEPSIEVDIDWPKEDPNCDRLTKGTGWLEILGAGMVHPTVLRNGGYDPEKVTGLRLRHGPAADAHAQARHRRHPPLLAKRLTLPEAVLTTSPLNWGNREINDFI